MSAKSVLPSNQATRRLKANMGTGSEVRWSQPCEVCDAD